MGDGITIGSGGDLGFVAPTHKDNFGGTLPKGNTPKVEPPKDMLDCSDFSKEQVDRILAYIKLQQEALLDELLENKVEVMKFGRAGQSEGTAKLIEAVPVEAINKLRLEL